MLVIFHSEQREPWCLQVLKKGTAGEKYLKNYSEKGSSRIVTDLISLKVISALSCSNCKEI